MAPDLNSLSPTSPLGSVARDNGGSPDSGLSAGPASHGEQQQQQQQPMPKTRPNILYIMADQLAAPLLKMHNPESQILTPNLDALAAGAVVFDAAYTPSPLCAPSRMSMMTGRLPTAIGAYDNAAQILSEYPTYAHHARLHGYHTVLAGKMHFVGDQLHGYEDRLTSDIYPADFGWVPDWDRPEQLLEWYHNASSVLQAGVCVRSNQLDYDEEVMYKSLRYLHDYARQPQDSRRPFCLTVSMTHPHDPYCIEQEYWDRYEGVDIKLPEVQIAKEDQDPHSKRLLKACGLWGKNFSEEQIKRARRAYYGACSYVDDNIGKLLKTLKATGLADDTIILFSGDHGDMLGERGLWYKMSFFENSARVPLLVHYPKWFRPHRVSQNVSTLDILPTVCDLVGAQPETELLSLDGHSLLPHLEGRPGGHDEVFGEYTGEGTVRPLMMIRRGPWKYITCPADGHQLFNLEDDPREEHDLVKELLLLAAADKTATTTGVPASSSSSSSSAVVVPNLGHAVVQTVLDDFAAEAAAKWDFDGITRQVLLSQRRRRWVWEALRRGRFEAWDWNPPSDGRAQYIRSHMDLDDLERMARFPPVDTFGKPTRGVLVDQAGSHGQ